MLLIGHTNYAQISLWNWTGTSYKKFKRYPLVTSGGKQTDQGVSQAQLPLNPENDEFFCVFNNQKILRVVLNKENFKNTLKFNIYSRNTNKDALARTFNHDIVNFRFLNDELMIITLVSFIRLYDYN
jgi:hypothetical protein